MRCLHALASVSGTVRVQKSADAKGSECSTEFGLHLVLETFKD